MITRYYEVVCDTCGCAIGHYQGNKKDAEDEVKKDGGRVVGKKHFCDEDCESEYKNEGNEITDEDVRNAQKRRIDGCMY